MLPFELQRLQQAVDSIRQTSGAEFIDSNNQSFCVLGNIQSDREAFAALYRNGNVSRLSPASYHSAADALLGLYEGVRTAPGMVAQQLRATISEHINRMANENQGIAEVAQPEPVFFEHQEILREVEKQLQGETKMSNAKTLKDALVQGAKMAEGKFLIDALEHAFMSAIPEEQRGAFDSQAVRHIARFITAIGVMKGGEMLNNKFGASMPQIGHVQEVGYMAASVETMQSMEAVVKAALPFLTQVAKNFMSNAKVQKSFGLPAGIEEMINEDTVETIVNEAMQSQEKAPESVPA